MPWTTLHWTILALLYLLAVATIVVIHQLDRREGPSRRQVRRWRWRKERATLPTVRLRNPRKTP